MGNYEEDDGGSGKGGRKEGMSGREMGVATGFRDGIHSTVYCTILVYLRVNEGIEISSFHSIPV